MTVPRGKEQRARILGALVILIAGLCLHLPRLDRPFGVFEYNAGNFFGVYARNFERFGLAHTRGVPLGPRPLVDASLGRPYLNHPPGVFWLQALVGPAEWQLRLTTAVGHIVSAVLLFVLLLRAVQVAAACLGGLCLLAVPVLAVHSQVSYANLVIPFGLAALLAVERGADPTLRGRGRWCALAVAACAVGPWMDWPFGFFCLGLLPAAWAGSPGATARRLVVPWSVASLSLALVFAWRAWAMQAPGLPPLELVPTIEEHFLDGILQRPPLDEFLAGIGHRVATGMTLPLSIVGAIGGVVLLSKSPRLGLALLIAGLGNPIVFAKYTAVRETEFMGYLAPFLAASVATLAGRLRRPGLALGAALLVFLGATTIDLLRRSDTAFFADLGRVLSEASADLDAAGAVTRRYAVCTHFHARHRYYLATEFLWDLPISDPVAIDQARAAAVRGALGLRYLWLRFRGGGDLGQAFVTSRDLDAYLMAFPRQRVPELEVALDLPPELPGIELFEAWLVTIEP